MERTNGHLGEHGDSPEPKEGAHLHPDREVLSDRQQDRGARSDDDGATIDRITGAPVPGCCNAKPERGTKPDRSVQPQLCGPQMGPREQSVRSEEQGVREAWTSIDTAFSRAILPDELNPVLKGHGPPGAQLIAHFGFDVHQRGRSEPRPQRGIIAELKLAARMQADTGTDTECGPDVAAFEACRWRRMSRARFGVSDSAGDRNELDEHDGAKSERGVKEDPDDTR